MKFLLVNPAVVHSLSSIASSSLPLPATEPSTSFKYCSLMPSRASLITLQPFVCPLDQIAIWGYSVVPHALQLLSQTPVISELASGWFLETLPAPAALALSMFVPLLLPHVDLTRIIVSEQVVYIQYVVTSVMSPGREIYYVLH